MDFNSIKNQQIKEKFIGNHVHACVTCMIEFVLTASQSLPDAPVNMDELGNSYYYEDRQNTQYSSGELQDRIVELTEELGLNNKMCLTRKVSLGRLTCMLQQNKPFKHKKGLFS